jgi:transcriptional regulator of PTS gene
MLSSRWPRLKNLELEFLLPTSRMEILTQRTLDSELNYMLLRNPEYRSGGTVMIHWGYGIGASYSRDGRVLRSGLGTFGEIGHLPMAVERDIPCQCGSRGCLETVAALWKLLPAIRAKFSDVEEDETALGELLSTERPADVPGVEEAVTYMARALATIYTVLYPDRVVIYGPFTQNKYLVKDLTDQARNLLQPFSRTRFRLDVRSVGPDSAAIGCTAPLFYRRMREELTAL